MGESKTCCDVSSNMTIYTDNKGNKYLQCKICGKIIKPIKDD